MRCSKLTTLVLSGIMCVSMASPAYADITVDDNESSEEITIAVDETDADDEQMMIEDESIEETETTVVDETPASESVSLSEDSQDIVLNTESVVKDGRTMYTSSIRNGKSKVELPEETTWSFIDVPEDGNYLGYLDVNLYGSIYVSIVEADTDVCIYKAYSEDEWGCWLTGSNFVVLEKGKSYNVKVRTEGKAHLSLKVDYERFKGNTLLNGKFFNRVYNGKPLTQKTLFKYIWFSNASISNITFSTKSDYSNPTSTFPTDAGTYYVKYTITSDDGLVTYTKSDVAKIFKDRPTIAVANTEKTLSYADLKKTYKSFSIGASTTGDGTLTYEKVGGSSSLKIKSNGRVYAVKGTAKGKHTITVKVKAAATKNYKAVETTQKITVNVK